MKKLNILFLVLCTTFFATKSNAQNAVVPNGGFETWSTLSAGAPSSPNGWTTSDLINFAFGGKSSSSTKVTDKKSGSFAILLKRSVTQTATSSDTTTGTILTGTLLQLFSGATPGFPVKTRPSALTGFYKFINPDKDTATMLIGASKYNKITNEAEEAGVGELFLTKPAATFTAFSVPVVYNPAIKGIDTVSIIITCSTNTIKSLKTELTIDDLGLTYPVSTDEFEAVPISIYPNPAFEYAYFDFSAIPAAKNIELFDIQGRLVNTSVIENSLFQLSLSDFSTGTYVYKVSDAKHNLIKTGKIEVLK